MVVLAGTVAGVATGFFAGAAERGLYATGLWARGGAATITPGTFDQPGPASTASSGAPGAADLPAPVLGTLAPTRLPAAARVAARIEAVDDEQVGGSYSAQVADLGTGTVLFSRRARTPYVPASTMKLLTSAAALSLLGPDHEFSTTVSRAGRGRIVLVGGGDPYLTRKPSRGHPERASLATLARSTVTALRRSGTTKVALDYDASLFSGPAWNPRWPDGYADQVTPVSALWVDGGRVTGVSPGPRVEDPAREAARAFAAELKKQGVTVTAVARGRAPASATPLARARSMPLGQIVEQLLLTSDNDAAEVVFRQVALAAGRPGTAADGSRAVRAELSELGLSASDAVLVDGSGLARQSKVPAAVLVELLRTAADPKRTELRALLTGLPVAGVEGSLRPRYADPESLPGRGVVRGKTGTLSEVHALAGYLRTADGAQLAFAFLINDAGDDYAARVWLDRVSTALSRCGC